MAEWRGWLAKPDVTDLLLIVTTILTVVLLVLGALYWPRITTTTTELSESSRIQGCRSQSGAMVTEARTEFDVARATRDTASTYLLALIAEALSDVASGDREHLLALVDEVEASRQETIDAEDAVVAATAELRAQQDRHAEAIRLSITDPSAFLAACRDFSVNGS